MSLSFLSPDHADSASGAAPARSPMEREALAAGARLEVRDGWNVAVDYGSVEGECATLRRSVGWCDVSHLGKLELQAPATELAEIVAATTEGSHPEPGLALRAGDAWWCPITSERLIVVCDAGATRELRERLEAVTAASPRAGVVDLTAGYGSLALAGPLAVETFARFTALDLRDAVLPVQGFRPGSVARTPAMVLREAPSRYSFWFGAALGRYMWTVVADAARHLGGEPVGVDALEAATAVVPVQEAAQGA